MPMRVPYRKPTKFSNLAFDPLMTTGKFLELKTTLDKLKKSQPGAAKEVMRLAELGDFSENVEYQLAKGRLRAINQHILVTESRLNQAVMIAPQTQSNTIQIGHMVTVLVGGKEKKYTILGSSETHPERGIISNQSPIGEALLGHHIGDRVHVMIGQKEVEYHIQKIEPSNF